MIWGSNIINNLYVFAYTFQPQYCYNKVNYSGCMAPEPYWYDHFTAHGLWPQYTSGGYPQYCSSEVLNTSVVDEIGWDSMTMYWPNVEYNVSEPEYTEFWAHEWEKHGTCSGLSQIDYLNTTIQMVQSFGSPFIFSESVGETISAAVLRDAFGGPEYAILQCDGSMYVSGVFTCWGVDSATQFPTIQITCPEDVQNEDTCEESMLMIESF